VSKNERHRNPSSVSEGPKCSNCHKLGHVASRCYLRERKDSRVNQMTVKNANWEKNSEITCYNCQGRAHMAQHCKKPKKKIEGPGLANQRRKDSQSGNESRPSESRSRPTVQSIQ
jgi:hypothetical protein